MLRALQRLLGAVGPSGAERHAPSERGRPSEIDAVVIPTANRPELLARCVEEHAAFRALTSRYHEVIVADDTREPATRARTRALLSEIADRHDAPIRYAGLEEKKAFVAALVAECEHDGVAPSVVRFAFAARDAERTVGANRNVLLAATAGRRVLSADDDTSLRVATSKDATPGLRLHGGYTPDAIEAFSSREAALERATTDFSTALGEVESLLGVDVAKCVELARAAGGCDLSRAGARLESAVWAGQGSVGIVSLGQCGDAAVGGPGLWLVQRGAARRALCDEPGTLEAALASRAVVRAADVPTITDANRLLAAMVGLDNREWLPPFFPTGRNQDGLFCAVTRAVLPEALVAHSRYAIAHDPPETRTFSRADAGFLPKRACDLVGMLAEACKLEPAGSAPEDRIRLLGDWLVRLGRSETERRAVLRALWRNRAAGAIRHYRALLAEHGSQPRSWASLVEAEIDAHERDLERDAPIVATDLGRTVDAAEPALAVALVGYGELLSAWPTIVRAAGRIAPLPLVPRAPRVGAAARAGAGA